MTIAFTCYRHFCATDNVEVANNILLRSSGPLNAEKQTPGKFANRYILHMTLFVLTPIYLSIEFKANSRKAIIITIKYNNIIIKLFISAFPKLKNLFYILLFIKLVAFLKFVTSWSPLSSLHFYQTKTTACLPYDLNQRSVTRLPFHTIVTD